jgi:hypothetical protein
MSPMSPRSCPACGRLLVVKYHGKTGEAFWACRGYGSDCTHKADSEDSIYCPQPQCRQRMKRQGSDEDVLWCAQYPSCPGVLRIPPECQDRRDRGRPVPTDTPVGPSTPFLAPLAAPIPVAALLPPTPLASPVLGTRPSSGTTPATAQPERTGTPPQPPAARTAAAPARENAGGAGLKGNLPIVLVVSFAALLVLLVGVGIASFAFKGSSPPSTPATTSPNVSTPTPDVTVLTPATIGGHLNEQCVFEMRVKAIGPQTDFLLLDSEANFKNPNNVSLLLDKKVADSLKSKGIDNPRRDLPGKTIRVQGRVSTHDNRPQIKVNEPDQVLSIKP